MCVSHLLFFLICSQLTCLLQPLLLWPVMLHHGLAQVISCFWQWGPPAATTWDSAEAVWHRPDWGVWGSSHSLGQTFTTEESSQWINCLLFCVWQTEALFIRVPGASQQDQTPGAHSAGSFSDASWIVFFAFYLSSFSRPPLRPPGITSRVSLQHPSPCLSLWLPRGSKGGHLMSGVDLESRPPGRDSGSDPLPVRCFNRWWKVWVAITPGLNQHH